MRSKVRLGLRPRRLRLIAAAAIALLAAAAVHGRRSAASEFAKGQSSQMTPFPPSPVQNQGRPPAQPGQDSDASQDPIVHHALIEAAKKRNVQRQNKLQADSDRIVALARQLSAAIEAGPAQVSAAEMAKKADEIGRLARSVRELMKSE